MSWQEVRNNFEQLTKECEKIISGKNVGKIKEILNKLYNFYNNPTNGKLSEKELEAIRHKASVYLSGCDGLVNELCNLLVGLYSKNERDSFKAMTSSNSDDFLVMRLGMGLLHNFTDASTELCITLSHNDAFFRNFMKPALIKWRGLYQGNEKLHKLVMSVLGVLYNMFFKNNSEVYDSLSQLDVVEPVKPYLRSPNVKMQLQVLVLIAFALDESHADLYLGAKEVIQHLVEQLDNSLKDANRRSSGYHVVELAVCTNRLALNDVNKKLLVELQLLPVLAKMCSGGKDDEIKGALDILFTLSFNEDNKRMILQQLGQQLQSLYKSGQWSRNKSLQGLDFNLNEEISKPTGGRGRPGTARQQRRMETSEQPSSGPSDPKGAHVMISYQHEHKDLVRSIRDALGRANIKVWIDFDCMNEGCTMDLMAEAVEGAYAFVMCMSRMYKESNNCRMEAMYAQKLGKRMVPVLLERGYKPTGWLGFLLGNDLYYDFSGKYPFESKLAELLKVLQR